MTALEMPKKDGEMHAGDAVRFFDNIKSDGGEKLTQSEKRGRLRWLMEQLYKDGDLNKVTLSDGSIVPIVVKRSSPRHAPSCYFNTVDVPAEIIINAFASRTGITSKLGFTQAKQQGELIVSDVKHLFDNITSGGKKLSGFKKQERLKELFKELYHASTANICHTSDGEIPIIVERVGVNNHKAYCLNAINNRAEVMEAFAKWAGCTYLSDKENMPILPNKQQGELTVRECAKIFHKVEYLKHSGTTKYPSERLNEWFSYIYKHPHLNRVVLPNGHQVDLIVHRQSLSQKCLCLNTADEQIKPFVIKRISEITKSEICLKNITIHDKEANQSYKIIKMLAKAENQADNDIDKKYYLHYAEKVFHDLKLSYKEANVTAWLSNKILEKSK